VKTQCPTVLFEAGFDNIADETAWGVLVFTAAGEVKTTFNSISFRIIMFMHVVFQSS
jgi:hypothetical protein